MGSWPEPKKGRVGLWRHPEKSRSSPAPAAASAGPARTRCWKRAGTSCWPAAAMTCWKRPPRTPGVPTDIRDPAQIDALFAAVRSTYGRIDLLFNNAGISTRGIPFEELTYEQWSDVVAVNLTGSFLCAQHAFRMMKAQDPQGGRIINNGSVSAHVPRRNSTPYSSTKHALTGLTRSLSLDGREYNIACGQIDIGNAATTRNEDTARGRLQASGRVEAEARIDVRDVAKGVLYMAELPPEANVLFMTVMANKMPYIGRG